MKSQKFNEGRPPHKGWWMVRKVTSSQQDWRWFDGSFWSMRFYENESANNVARQLSIINRELGYYYPADVFEWSDYWPKNAPFMRADPDKPETWCEVDGVTYIAKYKVRCDGCAFDIYGCNLDGSQKFVSECHSTTRKDRKSIIWVKSWSEVTK